MFRIEKNYETMTFSREDYGDEIQMWKDISIFMQMLMKNKKVCKVYDEGVVVVVQYGHDEHMEAWGCPSLCWLEEDEQELVYDYREERYREECES